MSAGTLEAALRARGMACRVEAADRLAVLVPDRPMPELEDATVRRELLAMLRQHDFTHLALELVDDAGADAALHRG